MIQLPPNSSFLAPNLSNKIPPNAARKKEIPDATDPREDIADLLEKSLVVFVMVHRAKDVLGIIMESVIVVVSLVCTPRGDYLLRQISNISSGSREHYITLRDSRRKHRLRSSSHLERHSKPEALHRDKLPRLLHPQPPFPSLHPCPRPIRVGLLA